MTPVLLQPGKLTTAQKETMVPKSDTEKWEYYKYLKIYIIFNPGSLSAHVLSFSRHHDVGPYGSREGYKVKVFVFYVCS